MRLYQHSGSPKWYTDVYTNGKRHRLPLYESERISREFASKVEAMIGQHESGISFDRGTQLWLSQLPPAMIRRFSKMGLVSLERAAGTTALADHIDEWKAALLNKGTSQSQADLNHQRVTRIFTEAGFRSLTDISGNKVMTVIGQLQTTVNRRNKKTDTIETVETGPASSLSKRHHLQAVKQFAKWAFINGRLSENPLVHLMLKNVRVENHRRALSVDELTYLLEYVETAPASWNVPGHERALIYELAVNTGLRRDEIGSLKRTSFDFKRLTVQVADIDTKNKKPALLPIKAALMDKIKQHLSNKLPTAAVFRVPDETAKMIQKDMRKARAKWIEAVKDNPKEHQRRNDSDFLKVETHEGKCDFHCLRHSFGTFLAASGVHPKVAMDLMRHSDINLTMALYTHSNQEQAKAAIDSLPSFGQQPQTKRKKA